MEMTKEMMEYLTSQVEIPEEHLIEEFVQCASKKKKFPLVSMILVNKPMIIKAVKRNCYCLKSLPNEILQDKEILLAAVQSINNMNESEATDAVEYLVYGRKILKKFWQDLDFVNDVIKINPIVFISACDKGFIKDILNYNVDKKLLSKTFNKITDTNSLDNYWDAKQVLANLIENKEDALLFVENGFEIYHIPDNYRKDIDVQLEYLKYCSKNKPYNENWRYQIDKNAWRNETFVLEVADLNEEYAKYIYILNKGFLKDSLPVVLKLAKNIKEIPSNFLEKRAKEIKDDEEIVSILVGKNGLVLKDASERLQDNEEIAFSAIKNNKQALKYISTRLVVDKPFETKVIKAVPGLNSPLFVAQRDMMIAEAVEKSEEKLREKYEREIQEIRGRYEPEDEDSPTWID